MQTNHDGISAFIDDEPFEPRALADALADPEGRAVLFDLLALRSLVQPASEAVTVPTAAPHIAPRSHRSSMRWLAMAAAVLFAIGAGYAAGRRRTDSTSARTVVQVERDLPPAPTRVIPLRPAIEWHETTRGGH
jgi:hypothetical protein